MPRLAATLAGLALVGIPAAIAIASTDTASQSSSSQQQMLVRQTIQSTQTAPRRFHNGRHCHRLPGDQQNGSGSGTSGV